VNASGNGNLASPFIFALTVIALSAPCICGTPEF